MKVSDFFYEKGFYIFVIIVILISGTIKYLPADFLKVDFYGFVYNFILLLPEFLFLIMTRLFSFSFILSIILILLIVWSANNLIRIRNSMHDSLNLEKNDKITNDHVVLQKFVNERWMKVISLINSINENDWKLAILECDIILGDLLEKMGYMQESISEKLKAIEPSDFTNIESAWEAHKIRNMVAHEGSDFVLNEREAKRVIGLYELVFREFSYI
jgi:hypothetical protein